MNKEKPCPNCNSVGAGFYMEGDIKRCNGCGWPVGKPKERTELQAQLTAEPEVGKFTKKFQRAIKDLLAIKKDSGSIVVNMGREACTIIDQQARTIKLVKASDDSSTEVIGKMDEELKEQAEENKEMRDYILNEARHSAGCSRELGEQYRCRCGLLEFQAKLAEQKKTSESNQ